MENFNIENFYDQKDLDLKISISKIPNIKNIFLLSFTNFNEEEIIIPENIKIFKDDILIIPFKLTNFYLIEQVNYQIFNKEKKIFNVNKI
jgi:hypothetical protein